MYLADSNYEYVIALNELIICLFQQMLNSDIELHFSNIFEEIIKNIGH